MYELRLGTGAAALGIGPKDLINDLATMGLLVVPVGCLRD